MKKQFIAKLLVLAMVLTMVPATILAVSAAGTAGNNDAYPNNAYNNGYTNDAYHYTDDTSLADTNVAPDDISVEDGEAVIEAKVVAGVANVVLSEKTVDALAEQVTGSELVIKIEAPGAVKVGVVLPAKALTALGEKTGADVTFVLGDVATITIPNEAVTTVFGSVGSVKISAQASGNNVGFSIQVSGRALSNINGLKVTF